VLMFGGGDGSSRDDFWQWDGANWSPVPQSNHPAGRKEPVMTFDSARGVLVLFGGANRDLDKPVTPYSDTWEWDGSQWSLRATPQPPPNRCRGAMVFDSRRKRVVMFGGEDCRNYDYLDDLWEWDGQTWTQQEDTGPSPRSHHALAFDLVQDRVVLFGGNPGQPGSLGDTWSWDGSSWTQITTFGGNPCFNAAMVSTDVQIVLFGGMDSSNAVFRESWVFDGKYWTDRQDIGPLPRFSHAMSFDTARRTIVLFGGRDLTDTALRDTWEHIETEPPPPVVNVSSITVPPMSVSGGDPVQASIYLTSPARAGTRVELSWAAQGDTTHTVLSTSNVHEGDSALTIMFVAPLVGGGGGGGGPIQIFARTANSTQYASTILHVHP